MPLVCEMIYIVKIIRNRYLKISENQQLEFFRVSVSYQKKKRAVKNKNEIFTAFYAILHILTAFDR